MSDEWDPRKTPLEVALRRLKRRLKAAASIGLAVAAGTFLSFQKSARADATPPGGGGESKKEKGKDRRGKDDGKGDKDKDKGKTGSKKGDKDKGKVDKDEHRKGMPVRDNLLE